MGTKRGHKQYSVAYTTQYIKTLWGYGTTFLERDIKMYKAGEYRSLSRKEVVSMRLVAAAFLFFILAMVSI